VNVLAMFGPTVSDREKELAAALEQESALEWLPGRRPAAEAFFRPRISGIWSVFLVVGPGAYEGGVAEPAVPSIEVRSTFSDFLLDPPAFVVVDAASRLWPAWDDWQMLVRGGVDSLDVTVADGSATAREIAEMVSAAAGRRVVTSDVTR
jgi:hypothetical protein